MKKFLQFFVWAGFLLACSDSDEIQPEVDAPKVSGIFVDDLSNSGDGSDLEIFFKKADQEDLISEYRIFVVRSSESSSFDLTAAQNVPSQNYTSILPDGNNKRFTLTNISNDTGGSLIAEGIPYRVFILSVADGVNAMNNSLSSPSPQIELGQTSIKITYIGNDGVHITDGLNEVIVDALPGNLDGWFPITNGVQQDIEEGAGYFNQIDVAMVTHNHGDHFSPNSVNSFLSNNGSATLIAPPDVASSVGNQAQVSSANPDLNNFEDVTIGNLTIRVLHMMHFNAFGNDFSSVINFSYLINIGGLKVLHLGDFKYSEANLQAFNLVAENIDIVLIPALTPFLDSSFKTIIDDHIAPKKIIALHLFTSTSLSSVTSIYPDADVFTSSLEFRRY